MKNLKNLGKALTNAEQKMINGGKRPAPSLYACTGSLDCNTNVPGALACCTDDNHCGYHYSIGQTCIKNIG